MSLQQLRYPIGPYQPVSPATGEQRSKWIDTIEQFPVKLANVVNPMTDAQLDTPYRPGGWTVRQLVHHVADSHTNSYVRFKWAMTEDNPTIKTYDQDAWALQHEARSAPVGISLDWLKALHARWVYYLKGFSDSDFARTFHHPEMNEDLTLDWLLGLYRWHCEHHLAHITGLVERKNW